MYFFFKFENLFSIEKKNTQIEENIEFTGMSKSSLELLAFISADF